MIYTTVEDAQTSKPFDLGMTKPLWFGRREIRTRYRDFTAENVISALVDAMPVYQQNKADILYLWWYYRGYQPVYNRVKKERPEIRNIVVENRANEIVSFKVGYQFGEPIKYIGRSTEERVVEGIKKLNDMMFAEGKPTHDRDLGEWQEICGTSYRMVLPDTIDARDEVPFEIYTLDPSMAFVIYSNDYTHHPLAGVVVEENENALVTYHVYTKTRKFTVTWGAEPKVQEELNTLGFIPIIEYKANNARLGSFEVVITILDAINTIESNRTDAIEQFVQALMVFYNCDFDADQFEQMVSMGAVKLKSVDGVLQPKVDMLSSELNQQQTQTLVDYMYDTILTICGMPSRNGNGGSGDTGSAVLLRDGWSLAEARAKDREWTFKKAEQDFLRIVLHICEDMSKETDLHLTIPDIDLTFTRRNYEAVQSKAQVLDLLLKNDWVNPLEAYSVCGLFSDPEGAYLAGRDYRNEIASQMALQSVSGAIADELSSDDIEAIRNYAKTSSDTRGHTKDDYRPPTEA